MIKRGLFPAVDVSVLLYNCTTWILTRRWKKKFDENYTRVLDSNTWNHLIVWKKKLKLIWKYYQ